MELTGIHTFDHPQQKVWDALMDPKAIAHAIPGVEELVPVEGEDNAWRANAKIGIAAVSGRYSGVVRMSEIDAPTQYRLTVSGEGQQSIISGTALIKLVYDAESKQTTLSWDAHADINGNLARVGQRVIKSAAGLMSKNFFDGIDKQIPPEPAPAEVAAATTASTSPAATGIIGRLMALLRALLRPFNKERSASA